MSAASIRPPAEVAKAILPWRLPAPDRHGSPRYLASVQRIYAFSEASRSVEEVALAQQQKLERMRVLLNLLGTPQASFSAILVAGTKGKGSMAAILASILTSAGYRVGRYTQPHLYSYRERTWADGDYIGEVALQDAFEAMEEALALVGRQKSDLGPLTTFDVGTALSLLHFARARVQLAIVEVGVGGSNDATNVLEPVLSLMGPVGLDHVEVLGRTVRDIALQKFGVARRGNDLIVGRQDPEARAAIEGRAGEAGVRLHVLGDSLDWTAANPSVGAFDVAGPGGRVADLEIPLVGAFQRDNAAMAIAAAQLLRQSGWPVSEEAIRRGVAQVQWPGRFQVVVSDPLTIVDGAHNPTATRALAATVRDFLGGRPLTLVLGMSDTKDVQGTLAELAPVTERAVLTRASHPRAIEPEELLSACRALGLEAAIADSPGEALLRAWDQQPGTGVTLVTGSLFLVGDTLEWLRQLGSGG